MENKEQYLINRMLRRYQINDVNLDMSESTQIHKEGEEWEENGKRWKFEDGRIISISRDAKTIQRVFTPLFCPKCKNSIQDNADETMYGLYGHCFTCQIEFETQLKIDGKYKEWESSIINKNIDAIKTDLVGEFAEYKQYSSTEKYVYNEEGVKIDTISSIIDDKQVETIINEKLNKLENLKI